MGYVTSLEAKPILSIQNPSTKTCFINQSSWQNPKFWVKHPPAAAIFASPHFFRFQAMVPSLPLGENIFASVNPTVLRGSTCGKNLPWLCEFSMLFGRRFLEKCCWKPCILQECMPKNWLKLIWFQVSDWPAHSGYSASLLRHWWQNYAHIYILT